MIAALIALVANLAREEASCVKHAAHPGTLMKEADNGGH